MTFFRAVFCAFRRLAFFSAVLCAFCAFRKVLFFPRAVSYIVCVWIAQVKVVRGIEIEAGPEVGWGERTPWAALVTWRVR